LEYKNLSIYSLKDDGYLIKFKAKNNHEKYLTIYREKEDKFYYSCDFRQRYNFDLLFLILMNNYFSREVTVLMVGLITFNDLNKINNKQNQQLMLKIARNDNEFFDAFKKAIKHLQGEPNPQALLESSFCI
jgi:hypothetical protein